MTDKPRVEPSPQIVSRVIDGKFHIAGGEIIKTSSGEVVPEWEPLVLMRARDHLMLRTLAYYRQLCAEDGCTDYHLGLVDELIAKFHAFTHDHPEWMKQPGVTKGAAFTPEPRVEPSVSPRCEIACSPCGVCCQQPKGHVGTHRWEHGSDGHTWEGTSCREPSASEPALRQEIVQQVARADNAWNKAFSIPAGCGCTPFYADAREQEANLVAMMHNYKKQAGRKKLLELNIRKRVGVTYP